MRVFLAGGRRALLSDPFCDHTKAILGICRKSAFKIQDLTATKDFAQHVGARSKPAVCVDLQVAAAQNGRVGRARRISLLLGKTRLLHYSPQISANG